MAVIERSTVVGVFTDRIQAEQAINELRRAGFSDDQIGFILRSTPAEEGETGSGAGTGHRMRIDDGAL
jgi:hypothetical protein